MSASEVLFSSLFCRLLLSCCIVINCFFILAQVRLTSLFLYGAPATPPSCVLLLPCNVTESWNQVLLLQLAVLQWLFGATEQDPFHHPSQIPFRRKTGSTLLSAEFTCLIKSTGKQNRLQTERPSGFTLYIFQVTFCDVGGACLLTICPELLFRSPKVSMSFNQEKRERGRERESQFQDVYRFSDLSTPNALHVNSLEEWLG